VFSYSRSTWNLEPIWCQSLEQYVKPNVREPNICLQGDSRRLMVCMLLAGLSCYSQVYYMEANKPLLRLVLIQLQLHDFVAASVTAGAGTTSTSGEDARRGMELL